MRNLSADDLGFRKTARLLQNFLTATKRPTVNQKKQCKEWGHVSTSLRIIKNAILSLARSFQRKWFIFVYNRVTMPDFCGGTWEVEHTVVIFCLFMQKCLKQFADDVPRRSSYCTTYFPLSSSQNAIDWAPTDIWAHPYLMTTVLQKLHLPGQKVWKHFTAGIPDPCKPSAIVDPRGFQD